MKKIFISIAILFATLAGNFTPSFAQEQATTEVLPTMNTQSSAANRIWVGTFQIVWNEFMNNFVYGPIKFVDYDSKVAEELNKQSFKKSDISDNAYYTNYGIVSPTLKQTIENGIKAKFNETSDILNSIDWTYDPRKIIVYAMLKKDFKFLKPFDRLTEGPFGKNFNSVDYFGINDKSKKKLYKNVNVMFYNSDDDFAVKLYTKGQDLVLLYRTDDDMTFDKYYSEMNGKAKKYRGSKKFNKDDELRIPDISLYLETSFKDVEEHDIAGTNLRIDRTIETVDFKMNNEGVKLKSEAAIIAKMCAMPIVSGRNFYFTDNFVLFLIEKGKKTPYYAMKVSDVEALNKTGRNLE